MAWKMLLCSAKAGVEKRMPDRGGVMNGTTGVVVEEVHVLRNEKREG